MLNICMTRRTPPTIDFQDTAANADLESDKQVWRDSSLALAHGLDVAELTIDSLPGDVRDSFSKH